MNSTNRQIVFYVAELVILATMMVAIPLIVAIDSASTGHGPAETSLTELTQEALLLLTIIMFGVSAWRRPQFRGFLVLATGFFGAMFIREIDVFLDKIAQGFWVYPAVLLTIVAILIALRYRSTILAPLAAYSGTRTFTIITIGLLIVIIFSRAFGTKYLWQEVMGEQYDGVYKTVIQEGLELLGYALIFYGSVAFVFAKQQRR